jgi:phosphoglycolate phosphatase
MDDLRIAAEPDIHARLTEEFLVHYSLKPAEKSHAFAGVKELLDKLSAREFKLGICTNKPIALTHKVLDGLNLNFFNAVIGGDSLSVKKPDSGPLLKTLELLQVNRCIYVGDSEVDAQTAQNAGQTFFLFTEGYRNTPASQIIAEQRFNHFDRLYGLIEKYQM